MDHPYKTRAGGATVTVFVPYDCANHCPFCINKKEYADCSGFSLEAILRSIRIMERIYLSEKNLPYILQRITPKSKENIQKSVVIFLTSRENRSQ